MEGVDYSFSKPDPVQLYAAGKRFAALYIGAGTENKQLHPAERDALWAAKLDIVLLCEAYANSALQGYAEGVRQADLCVGDFAYLGVPSYIPVYFAADEDLVTAGDFQTIDNFCAGAASVIGASRVGMYGEYDLMVYLSQHSQHCKWLFQTYAWSAGKIFAGNHFYQYHNNVNMAGGNVDLCRSMQTNFGQWGPNTPKPTPPRSNDMGYFFAEADGSQYMADPTFERYWAFTGDGSWDAVYAVAGKPPTAIVTRAQIQAGTFGEYQGIYTLPRKPPAPPAGSGSPVPFTINLSGGMSGSMTGTATPTSGQ